MLKRNISKILFQESKFDSSETDQQNAIIYIDFDNRLHYLTYGELRDLSHKLSFELSKESYQAHVPIGNEIYSLNFPIVALFGDCQQYSPVFMFASNLVGLSFMSFYDSKSFQETQELLKNKLKFESFEFIILHQNNRDSLSDCLHNDLNNWKFEFLSSFPEFMIAKYERISEPLSKKSKLSLKNDGTEGEVKELFISYVIKTSGTSSQVSKVVFVPHDSILSNIKAFVNIFKDITKSNILICSPFTFDPSICDLFVGIKLRCCVCLISPTVRSNSQAFLRLFQNQNDKNSLCFTYMTITPSLWRQRFSSYFFFKHLKFLNFGGEISPNVGELKPLCENNPNLRITNLYGLTEMSVWASIFIDSKNFIKNCQNIEQCLPIGEPILDTEFHFKPDSHELIIKSNKRKCLILSQDEFIFEDNLETGDIFVENEQNELFFVKRSNSDDFIKINGIRCYLSDMKQQIFEIFKNFNILKDVFVLPSSFNNVPNSVIIIVLCFSSIVNDFEDITQRIIRHFITERRLLFPLRIRFIRSDEALPLNDNGKLDLKLLSQTDNAKCKEFFRYLTSDSYKKILSSCLEEVLGIDKQRIAEAFVNKQKLIELGIDSVKTVQIALYFEKFFSNSIEDFYETLQNDNLENILKFLQNDLNKKFTNSSSSSLFQTIKKKSPDLRLKNSLNQKTENICLKFEWKFFMEECVDASPLLIEFNEYSLVIVASHSGLVCALNIVDGKCLWKHNTNSRIIASPSVSCDKELIFIGAYDGSLSAIETITGIYVWKIFTNDQIKVSPVIFNEFLIIASYDGYLYSYRLSHEKILPKIVWKVNISNSALSSVPVVDEKNSNILVGTLNGTLALLNILDGTILWKYSLSSIPIFSQPILWNNQIIVLLANNTLVCLSLQTGNTNWNAQTNSSNFSTPILIDNSLLFGSLVSFNCFNLESKSLSWSIKTGNNLRNYTKIDDNSVLIISTSGDFFMANISGTLHPIKMLAKHEFRKKFYNQK